MAKFTPTIKQHKLFQTFGNENLLEILYGGAAGGGKSYAAWALCILKALEFDGINIGMARQTLAQIKKNSMDTFYEVANNLNIDETKYKYNENKGEIKFINGSKIIFFELRYLPSDPFYDRFGGALLTFGVIEEANGTDNRGKFAFSSRLGRFNNDIYNIPPHLYLTTNPGTNYVYSDFYIPWMKGELASYRTYIPAILTDNKYRSKYYADSLFKRLDKANATRLLDGDWNFDFDTSRLITYQNVMNVYNITEPNLNNDMYLTADIAFTSDKCIIAIWKGLTVKKIINYTGGEPEIEIERLAKEYNIEETKVVYDADGVGKYLKKKLPNAYDFINNSKPLLEENYENLKSQAYFKLAELINDGKIKIEDDNLKDLAIQEIYEIKSKPLDSSEGKLGIISKKYVKQMLGRSPDISDALAFRMVFEIEGKYVPRFSFGSKGR